VKALTRDLDVAANLALQSAANALEHDADQVACGLATFLSQHVDEIPDDAAVHRDTVRRGVVGIAELTTLLRTGAAPDGTEPPGEAVAHARTLAAEGVPLTVLIRIYRLVLAYLLDAFEERLAVAGAHADVLLKATLKATDFFFALSDVRIAQLTAVYERERERCIRAAETLRGDTITAILAGHTVDVDTASRALGYELRRYHVGLIASLWHDADADDGETRLAAVVNDVAARLGSGRPLVAANGPDALVAWLAFGSPPATEPLQELPAPRGSDSVRIAIGTPGQGIGGFRRTHAEATDAAAVARLAGPRARTMTVFSAVRVPALFARDPDQTRRFVRRQLGGLGVESDEHNRLRATLMVYFDEGASRIATSRRLGIHPNTVANRVRAARALLDDDTAESRVELRAALRLAVILGPAVLTEPGTAA
jgi:hypothetical protein